MKTTFVAITIIICGFTLIFGLSRFLEANTPPLPVEMAEADLMFEPSTLKKISLGFDGLIADYYWISSLQYIGRKIVENNGLQNVQLDNLKPLNPRLLYPMLDAATTLDPDLTPPYSYGATILPAIDVEQAIKISQKGIAAQPESWRMYHQLGYIYWKNKDFKEAAEVYATGATKPDAPPWLLEMSANMEGQGGSRALARQMYRQIFENAQDARSKELANNRLLQIDSFDERDAIRAKLEDFQAKNNRCANNWRELFPLMRTAQLANGKGLRFTPESTPLDPSDTAYLLNNQNGQCSVKIDAQTSKIPIDNYSD